MSAAPFGPPCPALGPLTTRTGLGGRALTMDSFLRSLYILATLSWSIWLSFGWTFSLA